MAQKTSLFTDDVSRYTNAWLQKQGFRPADLDGARPDILSQDILGDAKYHAAGPKDGIVDPSESFAVVTSANCFGKFVTNLQGSRLNPFTKVDAGFDLSWLKLNGTNIDVDSTKKAEWIAKIGGSKDVPGSLDSIAYSYRRRHDGSIQQKDLNLIVDEALRTTELGLLPLPDQLKAIDDFIARHSSKDTATGMDNWFSGNLESKDNVRNPMRRVVVDHSHHMTAEKLVSLYAQLRGQELEKAGQPQKAANLYDFAAQIDASNLTAKAKLGTIQSGDAGFASLKAAYDAGFRDGDLLAALAQAYAARGDYASAVTVAIQKRPSLGGYGGGPEMLMNADEIAWDLKIFDWARKDGNLLLVEKMLRTQSAGIFNIKDPGRQAVLKSLDDPEIWIAAYNDRLKKGDYDGAAACLDKAGLYNATDIVVADDGGLKSLPVKGDDPTREIIRQLRTGLAADRKALPQTLKTRYDALEKLAETAPIGPDFQKTDDKLKLYESAMLKIEQLDALSKDPSNVDLNAAFAPVFQAALAKGATADTMSAALDQMQASLLQDPNVPALWVKTLVAAAKQELKAGAFDKDAAVKTIQTLQGNMDDAFHNRIRHTDLSADIETARMKICSGTLHGDQKMFDEGAALLDKLERYATLERKKEAVFQKALSLYYMNTRFVFQWNTSSMKYGTIGDFEATKESADDLAVFKTITRLEKTNPALADWAKSMLGDCRATMTKGGIRIDFEFADTTLYNVVKDGPMVDGYSEDLFYSGPNHVASLNDKMEAIYGDDQKAADFFTEVQKTRDAEGLKPKDGEDGVNKDYQKRMELDEGVKTLPTYVSYLKLFQVAAVAGKDISPDNLSGSRDFMLARAKVLRDFLVAHQDWLLNESNLPSEYGAMADQANRLQLQALDEDITWLQNTQIPSGKAGDADTAAYLDRMQHISFRFVSHEQNHLQSLLQEELTSVDKAPGGDNDPMADLTAARKAVGELPVLDADSVDWNDPKARAMSIVQLDVQSAAYQDAIQKIDDAAFARAVNSRIAAMKAEGGSVDSAVSLGYNWISVFGLLDGPLDLGGKPKPVATDDLDQWNTVKSLWAQGKKDEARRIYAAMANASFNGRLDDMHDWAKWSNRLTAVEAITLAAVTAGAASEFAAPFAEAVFSEWGATQAVTFVNALTFTGSLHVYEGLFNDGLSGAWQGLKGFVTHPLNSAEEVALTFGMFKFMGLADALFERTLGKYATKYFGETGNAVGKFVTEGTAFQVWDFLQTNYMMIKKGSWDPLAAAKHSFNVTSLDSGFGYGFLFLIALKGGGVLNAPLARPLNDAAKGLANRTLGIDAKERELQKGVEANLKAIDLYFSQGKGSLKDLMDQQEALLLKQKEYLESLPEEIRNNDLLTLNGKMLENLRQFRSAYDASVLEKVRTDGDKNPYGVHVLKSGLLQYTGSKGVAFVSALRQDPSVKAVRIAPNGLVVIDLVDPLGRSARMRVVPMGANQANLRAMQVAAVAPVTTPAPVPSNPSPKVVPVSAGPQPAPAL